MEIHFVTGKGGVGKSSVTWLLAHQLSRLRKKSVYVVEIGDRNHMRDLDLMDSSTSVQVLHWTGAYCLREYAHHLLPFKKWVDLLFDHKVTQSLIQVAPALFELAILGKITSGPPRSVGPPLPGEILVVDCPATGHFLSLLNSPRGIARAIRFGPMGKQSRSIDEVLSSDLCHYHIVTTPYDLPIQEASELRDKLESDFKKPSSLWWNRVLNFSNKEMLELGKIETRSPLAQQLLQLHKFQQEKMKILAPLSWKNRTVLFEGDLDLHNLNSMESWIAEWIKKQEGLLQ